MDTPGAEEEEEEVEEGAEGSAGGAASSGRDAPLDKRREPSCAMWALRKAWVRDLLLRVAPLPSFVRECGGGRGFCPRVS